MISSDTWRLRSSNLQLIPSERCPVNIETPYIVNGLCSCVSSKHQQVRFAEDDGVTISASRCPADNGHNHPLSGLVAVPQVQQVEVIRCKTSTTCRSSIHYHL